MDNERFDRLVRACGRGVTRRGALGLLAGVAGLGLEEAAAKGTRRKRKGRQGKGTGKKGCGPNQAKCSGVCTDVTTTANCGACGVACAGPNAACTNRTCGSSTCETGYADCGGACVDTQTDPAHCDGCGNACPERTGAHDPGCSAGACTLVCDAGWADCDGDPATGCETPLGTPVDCGGCGDRCTGLANQCNIPVCDTGGASPTCRAEPANEGGSCNGGAGACRSGSCVPTGGGA